MAFGKKDEHGNTVTTSTQMFAIGMVGLDASGAGRIGITAGEIIAGLKVTSHASEQFLSRSITVSQIENALENGTKYLDTKTGNTLHVIGIRGQGGYTIVTDAAQKVLVTVEDFVQKLGESRYLLINN